MVKLEASERVLLFLKKCESGFVQTTLKIFSTARKSGNISHILKAFFVRHSPEYEASDSDRKVIQNLYSQMRINMVR